MPDQSKILQPLIAGVKYMLMIIVVILFLSYESPLYKGKVREHKPFPI